MKRYEAISATIILILLLISMVCAIFINFKYKDLFPVTKYIVDTVYVNKTNEDLINKYDSLMVVNDSLMIVNDSLILINTKYKNELDVSLFKLERIREYNKIAGKSNNIKFLRGWINRVLED